MKNKVLYSIIALLTIMLASQSETVTGFFETDYVEAKDRSQTEAAKPVPADTRKPVAVMQVNEGPLVRQVVSYGYVSATRTAEITAQVSARINRLLIQEGDWVEQGDTVVELEDELLRIAQRQAQEALDKALTKYANIAFSLATSATGTKCSTGWASIRPMSTMSKHSDSFLASRERNWPRTKSGSTRLG